MNAANSLAALGERIETLIDDDGRTVVEIAKAAGLARGTVYRAIQGKPINTGHLFALFHALGARFGEAVADLD